MPKNKECSQTSRSQKAFYKYEECLSALRGMDKLEGYGLDGYDFDEARKLIETDLAIADVIKRKRVNVEHLSCCQMESCEASVNAYNASRAKSMQLTKAEFISILEWLHSQDTY